MSVEGGKMENPSPKTSALNVPSAAQGASSSSASSSSKSSPAPSPKPLSLALPIAETTPVVAGSSSSSGGGGSSSNQKGDGSKPPDSYRNNITSPRVFVPLTQSVATYKTLPPFPSYHSSEQVYSTDFPSRWFEVPNHAPPDGLLKAPRIRLGPQQHKHLQILQEQQQAANEAAGKKEKKISKKDLIATEVRGLERMHTANLSYQNLGDEFQYKHLLAVLRQLSGVHTLVLNHNMLTDVSDVYLPHVEVLYVSNNEFTSLKRLPRCPNLRTLNCGHNHIKDAGGLEAFPHLESLVLRWNPIADDKDYQAKIRKVVQKKLPKFKFLDELPFQ